MKKLLFIIFIIFILSYNIYGQDSTKHFVSTIGSKLYLNKDSKFFTKCGVIKIGSIESKNKFVEILKSEVLFEKYNHKMMVNILLMQVENRNYSKETVYVIYSSPTFTVDLSQPYYLGYDPYTLMFDEKENKKPESEYYSSIRVYVYEKSKNAINKFILNDNSKTELVIEEL